MMTMRRRKKLTLPIRNSPIRPMAQERRGANELNLFLAFVPQNEKTLSESAFDVYLVNDCNYYFHYSLFTYEGRACTLRHEGEIAPNTKVMLEELQRGRIEEWERITVQTLAFKRDKSFLAKPSFSINVRVDGTKFYKLHTFHATDFFHHPALVYNLIKDDHAARSMFVDADELQEAMQTPEEQMHPQVMRVSAAEKRAQQKQDRNAIIEVDLHADELLDTLAGLDSKDILLYQLKVFRETLNEHLKNVAVVSSLFMERVKVYYATLFSKSCAPTSSNAAIRTPPSANTAMALRW